MPQGAALAAQNTRYQHLHFWQSITTRPTHIPHHIPGWQYCRWIRRKEKCFLRACEWYKETIRPCQLHWICWSEFFPKCWSTSTLLSSSRVYSQWFQQRKYIVDVGSEVWMGIKASVTQTTLAYNLCWIAPPDKHVQPWHTYCMPATLIATQ